ncbi:SigE family RNA polymerase sigma factor [Nocardioides daeguensis]|uniref:SigE family RNA polymerase sigma factor n=1 Tax=Nocardioides daeguensis TaxID=908359 RepID=A0ABP6WC52_9ACTN|nr:SigE family RNA polymerase sigma factor [Nocardioides daeguensis]MBV6729264.1 sigma-70 family RNA polymerase sigma factor [Nocardioides daeguensis]MCR1774240.1 sigma-70 family RNA polymerase sigma factor [Nocardioides daeguensis]
MTVPDPFEELARAQAPHLYRAAWLLCGHRAEAEDLVQETLAKVYVRMHRRLGPRLDNPAAYAQTVLTRTFISGRRRRSSTETPYADLPGLETESAPDHADATDLRLALTEALAGLAPVDRAVVVLRHLEGLSVDEVGGLLGLTSGAVRNRSMRALARMREEVAR